MHKIFRNSFFYILIGFLPVAANFFLAPVYTRYLVPTQYALIGIGALFQTFVTFFISLSLDGAYSRIFFTYEKNKRLSQSLFSSLILTAVVSTLIILGILLAFGNYIFQAAFSNPGFKFSNLGFWVLLTTFANVIFALFAILYRNQENIKAFTTLSIAFFFVPVIGTLIGLIFFKGGAKGAIMGRALGSLSVIGVLLVIYYSKNGLLFNTKMVRKALNYSLPLIPYQLMFAAFSNIDRIILERFFTAHQFGIYNFASLLSGLVPVFINSLNNAIYPSIYREMGNSSNPVIVKSFNYISLFVLEGIICVAIALVVPFMRLIISKEYSASYPYVATLFLTYLPYLHYLIFSIPFFYFGKTKVFPVISFWALIAGIVFNYIFIPHFGIWSVCISLYVIRTIQFIIAYSYAVKHKYNRLEYIKHNEPLLGSLLIIIVYNLILFLNETFKWVDISFINLIPLIVFLFLTFFIYGEVIKKIKDVSGLTLFMTKIKLSTIQNKNYVVKNTEDN